MPKIHSPRSLGMSPLTLATVKKIASSMSVLAIGAEASFTPRQNSAAQPNSSGNRMSSAPTMPVSDAISRGTLCGYW